MEAFHEAQICADELSRSPSSIAYSTTESRRSGSPLFAPTSEERLYPRLADIARLLPGASHSCHLFPQFEGPWGVPDLVALVGGQSTIQRRQDLLIPPVLSEHDCIVLAAMYVWTSPEEVAKATGLRPDAIRRRISRLSRLGAILRARNGRIRAVRDLRPVGRIWALEAKIDDWRGGLAQAHRYRMWADGAILMLATAPTKRDELIQRASSFKIGVWAGNGWLARPRIATSSNRARRLWASEHVIKALSDRS